jgi:hypothetical protein
MKITYSFALKLHFTIHTLPATNIHNLIIVNNQQSSIINHQSSIINNNTTHSMQIQRMVDIGQSIVFP